MRIVLKKHKYRSIGVQYKPMISDFSAIAMRDSKDVCYKTVYTNESVLNEHSVSNMKKRYIMTQIVAFI